MITTLGGNSFARVRPRLVAFMAAPPCVPPARAAAAAEAGGGVVVVTLIAFNGTSFESNNQVAIPIEMFKLGSTNATQPPSATHCRSPGRC